MKLKLLAVLPVLVLAVGCQSSSGSIVGSASIPPSSAAPVPSITTEAPAPVVTTEAPAPAVTTQPPAPVVTTPPAPVQPAETLSQSNAVSKAQDYLGYTSFSRQGLIDQLGFDQFSTADATYAVDKISPDWNQEAVKKAKDYLGYTSFSRQGLVDQLTFDGFTPGQAEFGVSQAGL